MKILESKNHRGLASGALRGFQLCGNAANAITIAGQTFVPDSATAYIEFYMAHAFPLFIDTPDPSVPGERPYCSTLHPQVIENSYRSLVGKPINLAHLIKAYDPKRITKDHVFGTVMAVEFPQASADGWRVQGSPSLAPGIRCCAALHKNVEGVNVIIDTWNKGVTPFSETPWTVSMENESEMTDGGFLVNVSGVKGDLFSPEIHAGTPEDFKALGWCYVPYANAPKELLACLRDDEIIGLKADYCGCPTLFLNGGLNGKIFFYGVALVPLGRESAARVARLCAGAGELVDLSGALDGIADFASKIAGQT